VRFALVRLCLVAILVLAGLSGVVWAENRTDHVTGHVTHEGVVLPPGVPLSPIEVDGVTMPARVQGTSIALASNGRFVPRFLPGVNLGSTVPGREPGEVSVIPRSTYDRWLTGMGHLGARVVRVYTILPPQFYEALDAYNRSHAAAPIGLIQGVWIPELEFVHTEDAYSPAVTNGFKNEIKDAVAVVHGDADLPIQRGHAGGRYSTDVSRWLVAWSLGVEWDPSASRKTNWKHTGMAPYQGTYITAKPGALPMDSWLASMLDYCARLEIQRGWSRPLTFTNWITTDPLRHYREPNSEEDEIQIDPTKMRATKRWPGGFFASYHAYPYYPDGQKYQPDLLRYRRADGQHDPYAGYLHDLRAYHKGMAVMISEFGVPTSLGVAHRGPLGRDQGDHSEQEAGRMDARMLRDIQQEGMAGGLIFEYTDEWFKFTWNTTELEIPAARRQLWRNDLTNEEHFGLVSMEPGTRPTMTLDGQDGDWQRSNSQMLVESRGPVQELRATHDEEYLWLRLRLQRPDVWQKTPITLGFDVRPGGNRGLPGTSIDPDADVALTIGPGNRAHIVEAASIDPAAYLYGLRDGYLKVDRAALQPGSGAWVSPRLILDKPFTVPGTTQHHDVQMVDVGRLPFGTGDPASPAFDERNLVDGHGTVLELRIPWALLTFSDPSSRQVWQPHADGTLTSRTVGPVGIDVVLGGRSAASTHYTWENWNRVSWHERRKAGWNAVAAALASSWLAGAGTTASG
jgi:hypothetical protein